MKLLAVCKGNAERLAGRTSGKTGICKIPFAGPQLVDREGLVGDAIVNRKYHGGPDQALYLEGSLDLDWWSAELGRQIKPGTFGENLVIEGLENQRLAVGDRFEIGDVLLEITSPRIPCSTFAARMGDPKFIKRYTRAGRPGAYTRVLQSGALEAGQPVRFIPYEGARVRLGELMETFGRRLSDADRARYLAAPIHFRLRAALEAGGAV